MRTRDLTRESSPRSLRIALLHIVLFAAMGLPLAGCGEKKSSEPVDVEPEKSPEELAKEAEAARLELVQDRLTRTKALISQNPDDWSTHIENLEGRLLEAEGTYLEKDVKSELDKMIQSRERAARKRFDELADVVRGLVTEEEYDEAYEVLENFDPDGLLTETTVYREYVDLNEWIERAEDAEMEYNRISSLASSQRRHEVLEDVAKAIGNLESYPDFYNDTKYYSLIQEQIEDYLELYLTLRAEELAVVSVPDQPIEIDDYLGNFISGPDGVWTATGGEINGVNGGNSPGVIQMGDKRWISYQIRLFLKTPADQELRIAATGFPAGRGSKLAQFTFYPIALDTSDWVEVRIVYRDGRLSVQNLDTLEELIDPLVPRGMPWGVAFGIAPGEEVQIKDITAKVFEQEEAEENAEEEGR